jgi:general stress protein YciG
MTSDNRWSENGGEVSVNDAVPSAYPAAGNDGLHEQRQRSVRGFAAMSPERQKEIARVGGKAAHQQGVAHQWNSEEARNAGKKGGQSVSQNREHMSEIGRRGGKTSGSRRSRDNNTEGSLRE